jgi:hypothetical protein
MFLKDNFYIRVYLLSSRRQFEICYNIFYITIAKKEKQGKNVQFSFVIYFVYNINCHFAKHGIFTETTSQLNSAKIVNSKITGI